MHIIRCFWPATNKDDNILSGECLVDIIYSVVENDKVNISLHDVHIHPILTRMNSDNIIIKYISSKVNLSSELKSLYVKTLGYDFITEVMKTHNNKTQN